MPDAEASDRKPLQSIEDDEEGDEIAGLDLALDEQPASGDHTAEPQSNGHIEARSRRRQQTMIPILITSGAMMIGIAAMHWIVEEDSVLADVPTWTAWLMIALGAAVLSLAAINMRSVKREQLRRMRPGS